MQALHDCGKKERYQNTLDPIPPERRLPFLSMTSCAKTCHHKEKLHTEHEQRNKAVVEWIGLMLTHHPDPLILHEKWIHAAPIQGAWPMSAPDPIHDI